MTKAEELAALIEANPESPYVGQFMGRWKRALDAGLPLEGVFRMADHDIRSLEELRAAQRDEDRVKMAGWIEPLRKGRAVLRGTPA